MSYSLSNGHAPITEISIPWDVLMPSGSSLLVTFVSLCWINKPECEIGCFFQAEQWWGKVLVKHLPSEAQGRSGWWIRRWHAGDMALYSKGEHGEGPPSWHTRVQEGLRWTTGWECVQRTTVHTAKNTNSHKQFHFIYCMSYSLVKDMVMYVFLLQSPFRSNNL